MQDYCSSSIYKNNRYTKKVYYITVAMWIFGCFGLVFFSF